MSHLAAPNEHTAPGVLDQIEYQAKALVDTVRIEQTQVLMHTRKMIGVQEESRREEAGAEEEARRAQGSPEGAVYADLATEALGGTAAKLVKDGFDFLSDMDPGKGVSINGKQVDTFESLIKKSASKGEGLFGPAEANSLTLSEKFGQVSTSLAGQAECNTQSWGMKPSDISFMANMPKKIFGLGLAETAEATLGAVKRARELQAPGMGMGGMSMARSAATPTISLASGPKFSLGEEELAEESASWVS